MKLNKTKLKNTNYVLFSIGGEIKTESDFMGAIKFCIEKIKRGQSSRQANTLNEIWGIEDLEKLVNCLDFKVEK